MVFVLNYLVFILYQLGRKPRGIRLAGRAVGAGHNVKSHPVLRGKPGSEEVMWGGFFRCGTWRWVGWDISLIVKSK